MAAEYLRCRWLQRDVHVGIHRLCQLRIHLVRDSHDIGQQEAEIQGSQIVPQRPEKGDLEDSGVLHQHPRSVALQSSYSAMCFGSGGTDGSALFARDVGLSQADNKVFNQLREVSSTLLVGK